VHLCAGLLKPRRDLHRGAGIPDAAKVAVEFAGGAVREETVADTQLGKRFAPCSTNGLVRGGSIPVLHADMELLHEKQSHSLKEHRKCQHLGHFRHQPFSHF
jgi:hypothetical protein